MVLFLQQLGFVGLGIKNGNEISTIHYYPQKPTGKTYASYSHDFCSAGLEILIPKGGMLPLRDTTMIQLNWILKLLPNHFAFLMPFNQQANKRFTELARVIDPGCEGKVEPLKYEELVPDG